MNHDFYDYWDYQDFSSRPNPKSVHRTSSIAIQFIGFYLFLTSGLECLFGPPGPRL